MLSNWLVRMPLSLCRSLHLTSVLWLHMQEQQPAVAGSVERAMSLLAEVERAALLSEERAKQQDRRPLELHVGGRAGRTGSAKSGRRAAARQAPYQPRRATQQLPVGGGQLLPAVHTARRALPLVDIPLPPRAAGGGLQQAAPPQIRRVASLSAADALASLSSLSSASASSASTVGAPIAAPPPLALQPAFDRAPAAAAAAPTLAPAAPAPSAAAAVPRDSALQRCDAAAVAFLLSLSPTNSPALDSLTSELLATPATPITTFTLGPPAARRPSGSAGSSLLGVPNRSCRRAPRGMQAA